MTWETSLSASVQLTFLFRVSTFFLFLTSTYRFFLEPYEQVSLHFVLTLSRVIILLSISCTLGPVWKAILIIEFGVIECNYTI
ncbi:hypothetical protein H5410_005402 [Solanum commersonii]|uniref:Uncharacterized protein n=1 Tax=Solanum commersonii TaxID=4109 RepID=A0A9J6A735_SOLCO|nr:hypothetical protein H5410_005402 [Solanum commersonii]